MKVFVDIYHLPQLNLFKNTLKELGPHKVDIGCVNRGKLVDVIRYELPEFNLFVFGDYKYNTSRVSMALRIVVPRLIKLYRLFKKKSYDIIITAGYQSNIIARLQKIPNFAILDDPRKFIIKIADFFSDEYYLPPFSKVYGKEKHFNALKEWSYLSPKYFNPSKEALDEYNLKEKEYLFFREVSTETANYINQEKNLILKLSKILSNDYSVVLSLENKKFANTFPKKWIILKEPVEDIHSLMYYAKMVVSSGDSMAREGAMLGVPSIYCGIREMAANKVMIDKGTLFHKNVEDVPIFIEKIISGNIKPTPQEKFRKKLEEEWVDVNEFIIKAIKKYKRGIIDKKEAITHETIFQGKV